MSNFQKTIKYFAFMFATFLSIIIITSILCGVLFIGNTISYYFSPFQYNDQIQNNESPGFEKSFENIKNFNIKNSVGILKIKNGDSLKVESKNASENFICEEKNGTLFIENKINNSNFFNFIVGNFDDMNVILYIPQNLVIDKMTIKSHSGKIDIDANIEINDFNIDSDIGAFYCQNIKAKNIISNCGVGTNEFTNTDCEYLDIDCGIGKTVFNGIINSNSKIDCGIGSVKMELNGDINDYDFNTKNDIGSIKINGTEYSDGKTNNTNAIKSMEIDNNIGSVSITIN